MFHRFQLAETQTQRWPFLPPASLVRASVAARALHSRAQAAQRAQGPSPVAIPSVPSRPSRDSAAENFSGADA
jgi:hypothetical protein